MPTHGAAKHHGVGIALLQIFDDTLHNRWRSTTRGGATLVLDANEEHTRLANGEAVCCAMWASTANFLQSFNESAQELVLQSDEAIATPNASAFVLSLAFPFASARACKQQQRATCTRGTCPRRRRVRVPSQRSKAGVALSRRSRELRAPRQALHASSMPQCLDQPATAAEVAQSRATLPHCQRWRSTGPFDARPGRRRRRPSPPPPPLPLLLPLLPPLPSPTPSAVSSGARPTTSLCSTTASPSSQRSE
jgi:hypothetical protein